MTFTPFVIAWVVIALIAAALMVGRMALGFHERDTLHLSQAEVAVERQEMAKAHQLEVLERWSKIAMIAAAIYGAVLIGLYTYTALN
jgi:hypothetical protein